MRSGVEQNRVAISLVLEGLRYANEEDVIANWVVALAGHPSSYLAIYGPFVKRVIF